MLATMVLVYSVNRLTERIQVKGLGPLTSPRTETPQTHPLSSRKAYVISKSSIGEFL